MILNIGTQIGHDVQIDNFTSVMPHVDIGCGCKIGQNVFIGTGATIIPQRHIHDNAKVGAGSVVIKKCKRKDNRVWEPRQSTT